MAKRNPASTIIFSAAMILFTMYGVDAILPIQYLGKSFIKFVVFLLIPLLYAYRQKDPSLVQLFKVDSKRKLFWSILLGIGIYAIIMTAYFILQNWIDLDGIQQQLAGNLAINADNFASVALYISLVNSLLEEFFFRGFLFLNLAQHIKPALASLISATAFAFYHVAILIGWFTPALFVLAMAGLLVGGLIFNALSAWSGNIYAAWMVHLMANLAINTVGFFMYGII